jgi:pimeloyl-ACP methyl ester carboxylesterase
MRNFNSAVLVLAALLAYPPTSVYAQGKGKDPNSAFANEMIVAQLPGRSIAALVTHRPGATKFTHGIALFPGSPGWIELRVEDGQIQHGMRGNFLVRARRHFLDQGYLTAVIDAPSDQQPNFHQSHRETPRYGEEVRAIIEAVSKKYGALDWTFIGTSEGSVSAVHAARMAAPPAKRVVLTSSVVFPGPRGRGVEAGQVKQVTIPVLWVHHRRDPCKFTPYYRVKSYAEETGTPLVSVTGAGDTRGNPCEAFSEHGFVGTEVKVIRAILSWIQTGQVPPDVSE